MMLIAATILLVTLVGCLCTVWGSAGEGIGIPVIAIATFTYVYLWQPTYMIWREQLGYFLTDLMVVKGLLVPAAALLCLMWGWQRGSRGMRKRVSRTVSARAWSARRLYNFGLAAAIVGTVLHLVMVQRSGGFLQAYGQAHGHGFDWAQNTAYLYMSPLWVQSGLAMMIFSGNKLNLSGWRGGAIYVFAAAFALNGVLMGSRHDAFSICSILWVGWCLARRRWPTIARAVPALFIACSAALLMVGYRNVLHLGEHKPNTPSFAEAATTGVASEFADLRMRTSGVEFVAHAVTLETVDETQKYHWGLNWLYEYTVQVVPRIWWPEKPYRFETPGITQDDVSSVTGVRLASGYAPGLVADLYSQFGLLSLFFFMWLGWCAKRLVLRAVYGNRPIDVCAYIMAFSLSLNVFGQGFGAILVAFPYSMVPVLLYHWAEGSQRHMAGGLIAGCRFRPAAMRPIF